MIASIINILNQFHNKWVALLQVIQTCSIVALAYMVYSLNYNIDESFKKIDSRFLLDDRTLLDNQIQAINFDREDIKIADLNKAKILCLNGKIDIYYQERCRVIIDYIDKRR